MSYANLTLPEINRRLLDQRGAFVDTAAALRRRVRREARNLMPHRQIQNHPEAAMAGAALFGLIAGRIIGGFVASFLR